MLGHLPKITQLRLCSSVEIRSAGLCTALVVSDAASLDFTTSSHLLTWPGSIKLPPGTEDHYEDQITCSKVLPYTFGECVGNWPLGVSLGVGYPREKQSPNLTLPLTLPQICCVSLDRWLGPSETSKI